MEAPNSLKSHWFQPHNELRSHWSSSQNLGRVGGQLRICVASGRISPGRRKRISPADQQDLRNGELGVCMDGEASNPKFKSIILQHREICPPLFLLQQKFFMPHLNNQVGVYYEITNIRPIGWGGGAVKRSPLILFKWEKIQKDVFIFVVENIARGTTDPGIASIT